MDREERQTSDDNKHERSFGLTIFILMLVSFFLHISVYADLFFKNFNPLNNQTQIKQNITNNLHTNKLFNLLPLFSLMAHLIWTILPLVIFDQCCITNNKSIYQIMFKVFLCTCPSLFCSELSIIFIYYTNSIKIDLLIICIKWLIFVATILISFWTGIISNKDKWRSIHGGQIVPQQHFPLPLIHN